MGTLYATHAAAAVKQIDLVTVSGTWTTNDTATITINGKGLVVTIGANTTTAQVAQAICDAINAPSRLDSEGSTDATSNFGGQEFGEFAEMTASIDKDSLSVVVVTAKKSGVPFTMTAADTASGAATRSSSQTATGPWHWDNAKNWDTGAVPVDDDICVFKDQSGPNVGFKYGLPNGTLEITIQHWMSYTGQIGLPPINTDNGSGPYPEYRQQYVRLDNHGTGTNIAHRFGIGKDGNGSPFINIKHSSRKCSPIVYNTGSPQISGKKALNICCTTNTSTLTIFGGSVDFSSQDGGTSAFLTVIQNGGDTRALNAMYTVAASVILSGGTMLIGGTGAINALDVRGGIMRVENQTGTVAGVSARLGGAIDWASAGTMTSCVMYNGGGIDFRNCPGCTITSLALYKNSKFIDPFASVTIGSNGYVQYDPSDSLVLGNSEGTARLKIV